MRRRVAVITFIFVFFLGFGRAWASPPEIKAEAAVLMEAETGQVLYAKNPEEHMYPASTTKILTALVVLQYARLNDQIVASPEAVSTEGSSIWLKEGEKLSVEDALYALLLNSANDVAVALAQKVSGSVPAFAQLMNETAKACGATSSHFTNPHGLPDPEHYTTALDLARITRVALGNRFFREIVATKTYTLHRPALPEPFVLVNHNKLLWRYEGAIGVKTGYTTVAGQCLVAAARRNGRELIAVVLKSEGTEVWNDAVKLLDYGFNAFKPVELFKKGEALGQVGIPGGNRPLLLIAGESFTYYVPAEGGAFSLPRWQIHLNPLRLPVKAGEGVGEVLVTTGKGEGMKIPLVAGNAVSLLPFWQRTGGKVILGVLGLAVGAIYASRRRRKRRL
ncbi:D-alanyl-D-alanine carboxypeptidase family protein [Ammonifex thiophilus]|uniref:serine-type D-Ala-D-Ala carboxypeptidase n=1 Tax=Ammonifex thiophilus TaxID=444093 RepID=A0A3D8P6W4_9THEO|nr:D-alanyl-D-alanine carboxypeptidase family protein [Ammonifex thiophilus]RDV84298.1 D-alanyl-D-alanine carboxypeptidase [Ammonifex thiophilus]